MHVLLAEDSATCAELTESLLMEFDPRVCCETVTALADVLACLEAHRYDLVVLDLTLIDTRVLPADLRMIRHLAQGAPLFVYSGVVTDMEPEVLHTEDGAIALLSKSTDPARVLATLGALLNGR